MTRLSFGAQCLDAAELARLGPPPSAERRRASGRRGAGARASASSASTCSTTCPGRSLTTWLTTLDAALALAPDHLSLYALTLDDPDAEGLTGPDGDHLPTRRARAAGARRARPEQDEDRAAAQYHHAVDPAGRGRWRGYEISNWARPGHESRHNLAYWQRRRTRRSGPARTPSTASTRRWNAARLDGYVAALVPGDGRGPPRLPAAPRRVDDATAASETAILGLRLDTGLPLEAATEPPLDAWFGWALAAELVELTEDERVVLTTRGRLLSNELFAKLV